MWSPSSCCCCCRLQEMSSCAHIVPYQCTIHLHICILPSSCIVILEGEVYTKFITKRREFILGAAKCHHISVRLTFGSACNTICVRRKHSLAHRQRCESITGALFLRCNEIVFSVKYGFSGSLRFFIVSANFFLFGLLSLRLPAQSLAA